MKKLSAVIIFILIVSNIGFVSCQSSKNEDTETVKAQNYDYTVSYIETPDKYMPNSISPVLFDDNGNFIHIDCTYDSTGYIKDMYAVASDTSGQTIFSCSIDDTDIIRYMLCRNDEYFLASSNQITVISNTGEKLYVIESDNMIRGLALSGDRIVTYISGMASGIRYIDTENKCIGSKIDLLKDSMLSNARLYNGDGDDFYITTTVGLYRANISSSQPIAEEIVRWHKIGLYPEVYSVSVLSPEEIIISASENNSFDIKFIKLTRNSEASEKTELKMVSFELSGAALKAAAMFNRENENISINIESVTTVTFNNLIASGDIPDIAEMYFYQNSNTINNYVKKGLFADMYEVLGTSVTDDYLDCLKKPFEYNGELPYIVTSFSIKIFVGKEKNLKTDSWTTDEFIDICRNLPDTMKFSNNSFVQSALDVFALKELVDYNEGVSYFDTKQFRDMLEISKIDSSKKLYSYTDETEKYNNLREDEVLAEYVRIKDFRDTKKAEYRFESKDIVYIGYPSSTGSYPIIEPVNSYAIMKESKNTGDAARFIEYLIQTDIAKEADDCSFPVSQSLLNERIKEYLGRSYHYITFLNDGSISFVEDEDIEKAKKEHGETMAGVYTQDDIDLVLSLMDKAKASIEMDETLNSIIYEEESGYLYGDKSVEETVKLIRSRVDIYINEQK